MRIPREPPLALLAGARVGAGADDRLAHLAYRVVVSDRLTDADLDAVAPFPWQNTTGRTVGHMVGWVNSELMRNTAEIGQFRLLRVVSRS